VSDLTSLSGACHIYAVDESRETVRFVCIPASQFDLTNSTSNCAECKFSKL